MVPNINLKHQIENHQSLGKYKKNVYVRNCDKADLIGHVEMFKEKLEIGAYLPSRYLI